MVLPFFMLYADVVHLLVLPFLIFFRHFIVEIDVIRDNAFC